VPEKSDGLRSRRSPFPPITSLIFEGSPTPTGGGTVGNLLQTTFEMLPVEIPATNQLNVGLKVVGEVAAHLLTLRSVPSLLLATVGAMSEAAASLEVFAAHAADI
jgi:hypothetical protein